MPASRFFGKLGVGCWIDRLHLIEKGIEVDSPSTTPGALNLHQIGKIVDVNLKGIC